MTSRMLLALILSGVLVARNDRYRVYPVLGALIAAAGVFCPDQRRAGANAHLQGPDRTMG